MKQQDQQGGCRNELQEEQREVKTNFPFKIESIGINHVADHEIIIPKEEKGDGKIKDVISHSQEKRRSSTRLKGKRLVLTISSSSDDETGRESDCDFLNQKDMKSKKSHDCPSKSFNPSKQLSSCERVEYCRKGKLMRRMKEKKVTSKIRKEFSPGSFVVIKTDFHASMTPPIWKVDGKALLQKYMHFEQEGQTLYKNTFTYSGWTQSCKDQYYPVDVAIIAQTRRETVVKFEREKIVNDDSD